MNMVIYVDIDDTICTTQGDKRNARDYSLSTPIKENIDKINRLYDDGHKIVYWTARGTLSGVDWTQVTKDQFGEWGVKHHEVHMGKPYYDLFICDKAINSDLFFGEING